MTGGIYEQVGEETVNSMDRLAMALGIESEDMIAFAAGRNAAGQAFAERKVPEDLSEAIAVVQQEASAATPNGQTLKPEFVLGSAMAAFAIRKRRGLEN